MSFNTTRLPGRAGDLDCHVASLIARKHHLAHQTREWVEASPEELEEWLDRTGCCVAGGTWRGVRTFRRFARPDAAVIVGMGGEVGRSYYWRPTDRADAAISSEQIVKRLSLPIHPLLLERCDRWRETLPEANLFLLLDLLYIEQRLSCWSGPSSYGHVGSKCRVLPLIHRDIFDAMLRLPFEYRAAQRLADDVIRSRWPSLLQVPFNRYTGQRAILDDLSRAADDLARAIVSDLKNRYRRLFIRHPNVMARLRLPRP
jgi:hypothetical protein